MEKRSLMSSDENLMMQIAAIMGTEQPHGEVMFQLTKIPSKVGNADLTQISFFCPDEKTAERYLIATTSFAQGYEFYRTLLENELKAEYEESQYKSEIDEIIEEAANTGTRGFINCGEPTEGDIHCVFCAEPTFGDDICRLCAEQEYTDRHA